MTGFMPLIVVLLALVAALSIAYLAWALTSDDVQASLEDGLGRQDDSPGPGDPPGR